MNGNVVLVRVLDNCEESQCCFIKARTFMEIFALEESTWSSQGNRSISEVIESCYRTVNDELLAFLSENLKSRERGGEVSLEEEYDERVRTVAW